MKKVSFYLLVLFIITSCDSVKRVAKKEHLLTASNIYVNGKKNKNSELNNYVLQKPNSKTFGLPLSLYFYNLGNPTYSESPKEWGVKNPKKYNFFKSIFSEKQSIGVAKSSIQFNNWFFKTGEAPTTIDDLKTTKTAKNLRSYYMTQGYFKSSVHAKKDTFGNKKGSIAYLIKTGNPLFLDTITAQISSSTLHEIYQKDTINAYLKSGQQYKNKNFIREAARLVKLFRNSGIYNFSENDIGFDVDTTRSDFKTNVLLSIPNNLFAEEEKKLISKSYTIKKITKINVYTDYSYTTENSPYLDSISYKGITYFAHKKVKYNPKYLSQSIFIKPNQVFSDTLNTLTRNHLKSLENFKQVSIKYTEREGTDGLTVDINLTPIEKFTLGTDTEFTHSNLRKLGISGKLSFTNRNAFKGTELFKFSFLGSFFNTAAQSGSSSGFFNAWEIGTDVSFQVPRFVAPFGLHKLVPKEMSPKTIFSLGTGIQKNIGLDRQTITALVDYTWTFNKKRTLNLELFNAQYIRNLNNGEYFSIYNSEFEKLNLIAQNHYPNFNLSTENAVEFMNIVRADTDLQANNPAAFNDNANVNNRYKIITSDFIIPTIAYTYTYNSQENYKDTNFSFFKIRLANSGNFISLLSNQKNSIGVKTIANTPIAQYFKTDVEYKKFWNVSGSSVVGFRTFLGIIIPYGKSDIPFAKSYFAGGSNDIRAWKIYDLGPGASASGLEFNVANFKFLTSLEYRFDLIGNLKGALFMDAGNIWDVTNSSFIDSKAKFSGLSSLEQIAVGTGFGARYNFSFLVLRLDVGFKTHEPYLNEKKWFRNSNFNNAVYNIGINYPF